MSSSVVVRSLTLAPSLSCPSLKGSLALTVASLRHELKERKKEGGRRPGKHCASSSTFNAFSENQLNMEGEKERRG